MFITHQSAGQLHVGYTSLAEAQVTDKKVVNYFTCVLS